MAGNQYTEDLLINTGKNLKLIMKNLGLTNREMAEILGLSEAQIKKIRKGKCLLEIPHGITICRKFNVNMERLYGVSEEMPLFKRGGGLGE